VQSRQEVGRNDEIPALTFDHGPNFMTKLTRPRHAESGVFRTKFPGLTATTRNACSAIEVLLGKL